MLPVAGYLLLAASTGILDFYADVPASGREGLRKPQT
jgi:hypothetical protein